jgi:hypothetical protein
MEKHLILLFLLITTWSFSQDDPESQIFRKVVDFEISKGNSGIYIQCEKPAISFDRKDFKDQTALDVPDSILQEIEGSDMKSSGGTWDADLLSRLKYSSDFIKEKACLTQKDVELLFRKTKNRQNIISISAPVFDNNSKNCVVSVTYTKFTGSSYGHKYFLKKVYGTWTVIVEFYQWMT